MSKRKKEISLADISAILGKISSKMDGVVKKVDINSRTADHHSVRIDKLFEYFTLFEVKLLKLGEHIDDLRNIVAESIVLIDDRFEKIDSKLKSLERRIDDFAMNRATKDETYKLIKRIEILESKLLSKHS